MVTTATKKRSTKKAAKKVGAKKAPAAKKATQKKAPFKGKLPTMKDVLSQHNKVTKAKKVYDVARDQASARKKEWEGAVADLSAILEDVKKGQTQMFD